MATPDTTNHSKQRKGFGRGKQHNIKIDMTPMVDLGFLLITFFIFTSTINQPTTMALNMPIDKGEKMPVKASGALTILPAEKGKLYYYEGLFEKDKVQVASLKEIRNIIIEKKKRTPEKLFFVSIKPTEGASYSSIVDMLGEMTISNVNRYALADVSQEEKMYLNQILPELKRS